MANLPSPRLRPAPLLEPGQALFLDFDGTLAELAARPEAVQVPAELAPRLHCLHARLDGALALLTGRRLAEVDFYLQPLRLAGAGVHGAELRDGSGAVLTARAAPLPADWIASLRQQVNGLPGAWLEDKRYSLALHYRQNPALASTCEQLLRAAIAGQPLELQRGHCVWEVRRSGCGKAAALRRLIRLPAFEQRAPVFIGDDEADEEAFAAAAAEGGYGIKVGRGGTRARHRLADVPAVHGWLRDSLRRLKT